jgi:polysaccharide pyruvyl transferase CsaB
MRVLVSAWVGSPNLGDELVFAALLAKLKERGADVTVTSLDPNATEARFGVETIPFRALVRGSNAVRQSDLVVFGGGGLLQDATSALSVPAQVWRLLAARPFRTPVVAVGLGAGPLRRKPMRALAGAALRHHSGCAVRDADSASVLAACSVPDVRLAADLAVSLPDRLGGARDDIVACLRPWGSDDTQRFATRAAAALDALSRRLDTRVRLVAFEPGRDDRLHEQVAHAMRETVTVEVPDYENILDAVGSARVVVAMRYHSAIAALLAARPVAMLGYLPKVEALAAELGTPGVLLGADAAAFGALDTAVDAALAAPDAAGRALASLREREQENDTVLDAVVTRG